MSEVHTLIKFFILLTHPDTKTLSQYKSVLDKSSKDIIATSDIESFNFETFHYLIDLLCIDDSFTKGQPHAYISMVTFIFALIKIVFFYNTMNNNISHFYNRLQIFR